MDIFGHQMILQLEQKIFLCYFHFMNIEDIRFSLLPRQCSVIGLLGGELSLLTPVISEMSVLSIRRDSAG
jgi:hypothetical protein